LIEDAERSVARPIRRFRRQKNVFPPLAQRRAVVIETAGVRWRCVEVIHALIERPMNDADRCCALSMRAQNAFAAQSKQGDRNASPSKRPTGQGSGSRFHRLTLNPKFGDASRAARERPSAQVTQ